MHKRKSTKKINKYFLPISCCENSSPRQKEWSKFHFKRSTFKWHLCPSLMGVYKLVVRKSLTLQNINRRAHVSLLNHTATFGHAGGVHTVHDGEDLHVQSDKWASKSDVSRSSVLMWQLPACLPNVSYNRCSLVPFGSAHMTWVITQTGWIGNWSSIIMTHFSSCCVASSWDSLFALAVAGERDISELGGVQCCGLCRDGLSLSALRLSGGGLSLNLRSC